MNPVQTGDAFLALVERSGLLTADQLSAYRADSDDPLERARALVRDRLLTAFQARQLLRGKFRGYFLTEKYKVLDELGAGGGGRVLLCEHLRLQKLVALKLLNTSVTSVPGSVERFLREARAAAAVEHPNIVRVTDFDQVGAVPFMVMEFVDGTNLHHLIAEHGPVSPLRAAEYTRQAATALEAARLVGLVHRDIKPANLILDRNGLVRLTDLGLARFLGNARRNHNLTQTFDPNSVLGTLDFIAPEQADNSSAVDTRADIYSLGYTLYYLLTGKMPFGEGSAAQKLMWHQLRHPEPISALRPDVPPELERVFRRMTEKKPDARFQTPAEVAQALAALVTSPVPPPVAEVMPKVRATAYLLGLSPTPTADVLVTPPGPLAPPTPSPVDTTAIPRHPGKVNPPPTPGRTPRTPGSGSHVLSSLPRPTDPSVGSPLPPSGPDGQVIDADYHSTLARPPRSRSPLSAGLGVLCLVLVGGIVVWLLSGKSGTRPTSPTTPIDKGTPPTSTHESKQGLPSATLTPLTGAGSSFVDPMMQKWAKEYKPKTGSELRYSKIGSASGVRLLFEKQVAFACTDAYLNTKEMAEAEGKGGMVHVPLVMGAVVATYNLPEAKVPLRFSGEILAAIFLGEITRWNDPRIVACNAAVGSALPDRPITVVHRSDGSGTTFVWTEYLSKMSTKWKDGPGVDTAVIWPVGKGFEGNSGVAEAVSETPGAIGYTEHGVAVARKLPVAAIRNDAGDYMAPDLDGVKAAARFKDDFGPDLRFTLTNVSGKGVYPICGTTWAVLYKKQPNADRKELVKFLKWAVHDGQAFAPELHYAPLPDKLLRQIDAVLDTVTFGP